MEATDDGKSMEEQKYWRMHHGPSRLTDTDLMQRTDRSDILNTALRVIEWVNFMFFRVSGA